MKSSIRIQTIMAGISAILAGQTFAIEAPDDEAPAPPIAGSASNGHHRTRESRKDSAYLGVVSASIPEMLAAHIGVKPGEGVIVRAVMPNGPAAKSGIAVHDVITRMNGKAIGSYEDLTRTVAACKPGEVMHIDLIHEGKAIKADVTLGARPDELASASPLSLDQLNLDDVPEDLADRVRGMIQKNLGGFDMKAGPGGSLLNPPDIDQAMREMKERAEQALKGMDLTDPPQLPGIEVQQGATIRMLDADGSVELKSNNDGKEVTVRDKNNQTLWSGPWNTDQDKAAAPEDVRKRVERLNLDTTFDGKGMRLQIHPAPDGKR